MNEDFIVIVVEDDLENSEVTMVEDTDDEDIISEVLMLVNKPDKAHNAHKISYTSNINVDDDIIKQELSSENDFHVVVKQEVISESDATDSCPEYFNLNLVKPEYEVVKTEYKVTEKEDITIPELTNEHVILDSCENFIGEFHEDIDEIDLNEVVSSKETEYLENCSDDSSITEFNVETPKEVRRTIKSFVGNKSYVSDLIQEFPELMADEELLVEVLANIMKEVKVPPLPEKYCVMKNEKFKCIFCHKRTDTLPAAGRHYQEKHGPRYLICYGCGVNFRSRTNLYRHEKRCTAPDNEIVLKARGIFLGRKGQNRPFLDYTRKFENGSRPHPYKEVCKNPDISQQPTIDNSGKYKKRIYKSEYHCNECPAVFSSKTIMEAHINKHLGRRPYRCDKCSHAYPDLCGLRRHYATHSNIEFICDICARSLKTKGSLIVHMNTHLPTKKFGCPECNKRYAQKLALRIHMNKVHRKLPDPFGCQNCPKRFPLLSKLKEHMQKHHGLSIMSRNMFEKNLPKLSDEDVQKVKIVMNSYLTDRGPIQLND